jgi:hypothetical protein
VHGSWKGEGGGSGRETDREKILQKLYLKFQTKLAKVKTKKNKIGSKQKYNKNKNKQTIEI